MKNRSSNYAAQRPQKSGLLKVCLGFFLFLTPSLCYLLFLLTVLHQTISHRHPQPEKHPSLYLTNCHLLLLRKHPHPPTNTPIMYPTNCLTLPLLLLLYRYIYSSPQPLPRIHSSLYPPNSHNFLWFPQSPSPDTNASIIVSHKLPPLSFTPVHRTGELFNRG